MRINKTSVFKTQKFHWNIGSIIAIIFLFFEILQLAMFANHTIHQSTIVKINIENILDLTQKI